MAVLGYNCRLRFKERSSKCIADFIVDFCNYDSCASARLGYGAGAVFVTRLKEIPNPIPATMVNAT